MRERPITFSGPMVRSVSEGRKTQHREIITKARVFATPEQRAFTLTGTDLARAMQNADGFRRIEGDAWCWEADAFEWQAPNTRTRWNAHIGYAVGERLWVREALERANGEATGYPADGTWLPNTPWQWKRDTLPSIFMPRWASRITLEVTEVRVQRLQEISEEDAIAEGCKVAPSGCFVFEETRYDKAGLCHSNPVTAFGIFWDELHGPDAWMANPWVMAISFKRVEP